MNGSPERLAIVLTGGGAKAAYQAGVLRAVARLFPDIHFDIITGVSAGAINALFLASRGDTLTKAVVELCSLWQGLGIDDVFRVDPAVASSTLARLGSATRVGRLLDVA